MGSDFFGGAGPGFASRLDSVCELSLSDNHAGFVVVETPGVSRERVEPLHAPKPPDGGVTEEADDVGVPNEV